MAKTIKCEGSNEFIYCHYDKDMKQVKDCWPCAECYPCAGCLKKCPYERGAKVVE